MDKNSTLYQLMSMRMNDIMNGITEQDEDYQALLKKLTDTLAVWSSCISRRKPWN